MNDYLSLLIYKMFNQRDISHRMKNHSLKLIEAEKILVSNLNKENFKDFQKYDNARNDLQNLVIEEAISFAVNICRKIFSK